MAIYGEEEGDSCNRNGCKGVMYFPPVENCSCHLGHPPCHNCTYSQLICRECGYEVGELEETAPISTSFLPDWMRNF